MTTLHITFVWHMHQPLYLDPLSGQYVMPWVGLHALKGYYDMPLILEECEPAKAVFNITPVLIRQILDYAEGSVNDPLRQLSAKPAGELSPMDRSFLLDRFFMCNWNTMVKPFQGYSRLLNQRGLKVGPHELEQIQVRFSEQDLRDLQVWYNLTWFGSKALDRIPELKQLKDKDHDFSEDDKAFVLNSADRIIAELLDIYRRLENAGRIELTTTPYYHPILPLVYDTDLATRCMPGVSLPERHYAPEDAKAHVEKAIALHLETFGRAPKGMWPAEGSVSPEIIPILEQAGIKWMGTDEAILMHSLPQGDKGLLLYKPHRAVFQDSEINMVFRDHGLSDAIGFDYAKLPAAQAVDGFMAHLKNIRAYLEAEGVQQGLLSVILDGENAWESFPDSGLALLRELYTRLSNSEGFKLTTVNDYIEEHPPRHTIDNLYTGSWIDNNFRIWIGHPDDNKAWDALVRTRRELAKHSQDKPGHILDAAWEELYAAQGSDWFWWYGDDFSSDMDSVFDHLFRSHLKNVYKYLELDPPADLETPFIHEQQPISLDPPKSLIQPQIDGRETSFFEWQGAGFLNLKRSQSTMYRSEPLLDNIFYGFDMENFYLRLDPAECKDEQRTLEFRILFIEPAEYQIRMTWKNDYENTSKAELLTPLGGKDFSKQSIKSFAADKIIELGVELKKLGLKPNDRMAIRIAVFLGGSQLEQYPADNYLELEVPDASFNRKGWRV